MAADIPPKPKATMAWEWITPEIASAYLALNFDRNRNLRKAWVASIVRMMERGEFFWTHQGIAFDTLGRLIDGQHRLGAIVASERAHWMMVTRGLPREHVIGMDVAARRNPQDQIRVISEHVNPDQKDVAVARAMATGGRGGFYVQLIGPELHEFLIRHWEAIRFCRKYVSAKNTSVAPIRAAVARAFYHADHDRLDAFLMALDTGRVHGPGDSAATEFRAILEKKPFLLTGGRGARVECYRWTASALRAFLERRVGVKLAPCNEEFFPLPEGDETVCAPIERSAYGGPQASPNDPSPEEIAAAKEKIRKSRPVAGGRPPMPAP